MLPNIGVEIIDMLDSGRTIADVEQEMEERLGEPVDVLDFANDLIIEYQMVYLVDGQVVNPISEEKDHFPWITERVGNFFFNRIAFWFYGILFASGAILACIYPQYIPGYQDLFVTESLTATIGIAYVLGWVIVFVHELAHLIAARSRGIGSRFRISHRLVYVVMETRMSNLVLLPPERRYRALLAGMGWDLALLGIGIWLLWAGDMGWISLAALAVGVVKLVNLTILMRVVFQFMFFMKTDIYYVLTSKWGCNNLLENTKLYLRQRFRSLNEAEQEEWNNVDVREKRVVSWYAWLYVIGFVCVVGMFLFVTLPIAVEMITRVASSLTEHAVWSWAFLDGVVMMLITLIPFVLLLWSWNRTWQERRRQQARRQQMV
jgi:hypothetical protein